MDTLLMPVWDSRKSFYGKARVNVNPTDGALELISYSTRVAWIGTDTNGEKYVHVNGTYSATTLRHIKDFLKQNGFRADSSKQIMADYGN